jgi:hypothetical protein
LKKISLSFNLWNLGGRKNRYIVKILFNPFFTKGPLPMVSAKDFLYLALYLWLYLALYLGLYLALYLGFTWRFTWDF